MNNKEAITYLEWLSDIDFTKEYPKYPIVTKPEQVEALQMAIKALCVQDKLQDFEYMCRLSGGADYFNAFMAISEKVKNTTTFLNNSNDEVNNSNTTQFNGIESKVKGMPEDDTISRAAAIDALADYIHNVDKVCSTGHLSTEDCEDAARSVLEDLPPVQQEDCDTCKHGYFGDEQCNNCRVRFASHYERRTDERQA